MLLQNVMGAIFHEKENFEKQKKAKRMKQIGSVNILRKPWYKF